VPCPKGDRGCRCLEGLCESGFVCSEREYCLLENCTPGEVYCSCDNGMCVDQIECVDEAVCRPDEPVVVDTEGNASGSQSGTTTSTSTTSDDASGEGPTGCTPGDVCGPCRRCDDAGACQVDVGMPCEGPPLQCADYLWGLVGGACYLKAAVELEARCDAFGECHAASVQDCPAEMGAVHISCDPACLDAPGVCVANAPAATGSLEAMCVESGPGPDCGIRCENGSGSELSYYECSNGNCMPNSALDVDCGAYRCENLACNTSCTEHLDCAMSHACDMMTEMCYLP
jgi:hypothetical protein